MVALNASSGDLSQVDSCGSFGRLGSPLSCCVLQQSCQRSQWASLPSFNPIEARDIGLTFVAGTSKTMRTLMSFERELASL